jgi:P pilus assembly chaperone PapD
MKYLYFSPLYFAALIIIALGMCQRSEAQVGVSNILFNFKASERPIQNVVVTNSATSPVYVSVAVEEIVDPRTNPLTVTPSEDVLVSPKNFSIEARGQRTVRLLVRKPSTDVERAYRVYFIPQDRGDSAEGYEHTVAGRTAVIKVATGMGILVFVEPKVPQPSLQWVRTSTGIDFVNNGNIQVYLGDGNSCPPGVEPPPISSREQSAQDNHRGCVALPSKRIYAGTSFSAQLSPDRAAVWLKKIGGGGEYEKLIIPPYQSSEGTPLQGDAAKLPTPVPTSTSSQSE